MPAPHASAPNESQSRDGSVRLQADLTLSPTITSPAMMTGIGVLPGVADIWQGHLSLADPEHNTSRDQIANVEDTADCKGNWINASIAPDGTFTITNGRNGFTKKYTAR